MPGVAHAFGAPCCHLLHVPSLGHRCDQSLYCWLCGQSSMAVTYPTGFFHERGGWPARLQILLCRLMDQAHKACQCVRAGGMCVLC